MKDIIRLLAPPTLLLASALTVPDQPDVTAELAVELAVDQFRDTIVNDQCENCHGTGKVGDGRIMSTCQVCRGTGKKIKSVLCKDGKCPAP